MNNANKICYQESEKCPNNKNGKCTDSKICGNQYPAGTDYELECFKLQKDNENLINANKGLRDYIEELKDDIYKQKSYISELEYQAMEYVSKEDELKEIIRRHEIGIKNANVVISELTGKEVELKKETQRLKKIIKELAELIQ